MVDTIRVMDWRLELIAIPVYRRRPREALLHRAGRLRRRPRPPGQRRAALRAAHPAGLRLLDHDRHRGHRRRARLGAGACRWSSTTSTPPARSWPSGGSRSARCRTFPWGRFVFFSDPDGNGWAVQEIPAARESTAPAAPAAAAELLPRENLAATLYGTVLATSVIATLPGAERPALVIAALLVTAIVFAPRARVGARARAQRPASAARDPARDRRRDQARVADGRGGAAGLGRSSPWRCSTSTRSARRSGPRPRSTSSALRLGRRRPQGQRRQHLDLAARRPRRGQPRPRR